MVRLGALWRKAAALLEQAGVEDAAFDARELCRLCCKADPLLAPDSPVPEAAQQRLAQLCARRARHEPLQYLLGEWDFLDFTVEVGPGVLIPRADTECVAETAVAALKRAAARPGREDEPAGLDLCAGTGVLAIALARGVPAARVTAVEKSGEAFSFLQRNCAALAPRVAAVQADVFGYENTLAPHLSLIHIYCGCRAGILRYAQPCQKPCACTGFGPGRASGRPGGILLAARPFFAPVFERPAGAGGGGDAAGVVCTAAGGRVFLREKQRLRGRAGRGHTVYGRGALPCVTRREVV